MRKLSLFICLALTCSGLSSTSAMARVTQVDIFKPETAQNYQVLSLTGTIEAKQNANLAPLQSGVVAKLFVEQGDQVVKGQKLMALDAKLAELSLAQLKAKVAAAITSKEEADRLYKEVVDLSKKQLVAETLMSERFSTYQVASAQLAQANAELSHQQEVFNRHTLYAPFNGVIADRNLDLGEWVTQQTNAFTLVEQDNLRLKISIPQEYYAQLANQSNVAVAVMPDSIQSNTIEASLNRLVAVASDSSRTFIGLVDLPKYAGLVAGMSAQAQINIPASNQNMLWLPKTAIKQHPDGGRSVFAAIDGKAQRYLVKVVKQQGNRVAVTGAPADLSFVVSGVELLNQGDALTTNQVDGDAL